MSIFKNIKVIELASVLAGPSVGQFFAELGAEVVKIENPTTHGDVTRSWKLPSEDNETTTPAYFCAANWGKKSVVLNLSQQDDLDVLHKMTSTADIVVCSYKKGDAEKLHVDYETLKKSNNRLIYANITGYTHSSRPGYDAVIQAESGLMYMNGTPDGLPIKMPLAFIDILAAHQLKEGILVALLQRERTGLGSRVDISLFDAAISSLTNQATNYLCAGHDPERIGSEHPNIAPYGTIFLTKDHKMILLAVGTDKQFRHLTEILDIKDVAQDGRFATNAARVKNRSVLIELLKQGISKWHFAPLLTVLEENNIPAGAVNKVSEALNALEAQDVKIEGKGIKNAVFRIDNEYITSELAYPPKYPEG